MTTRRQFLRGSVAAAVAASLPAAAGDGVELTSIAHPALKCIEQGPRPVFLPFVTDNDTGMYRTGADTLELVAGGVKKITMGEMKKFFTEEIEVEIADG